MILSLVVEKMPQEHFGYCKICKSFLQRPFFSLQYLNFGSSVPSSLSLNPGSSVLLCL